VITNLEKNFFYSAETEHIFLMSSTGQDYVVLQQKKSMIHPLSKPLIFCRIMHIIISFVFVFY